MKLFAIVPANIRPLLFVLLAALLLRALFMGAILNNFGDKGFYPSLSEDSEQYWQLARNLAEHNVFSRQSAPPFNNELFRTPGYPVFISFFYRIIPLVWFTIIFQNLVALANVILIHGLTILLFRKKIIALISAGIYAIEPAVIYWNNQLLSETLFTFMILLAVYVFIRNIYISKRCLLPTALIIGTLVSFAGYIRPIAQFVLLVFMLFGLLILKTSFKNIRQYLFFLLLMAASFFILSMPWAIRSKILINAYDFSTASTSIGVGKYLQMMYLNRGDDVREVDRLFLDPRKSTQLKLAAVKYVAKHPLTFAKIHLLNLAPFLLSDSYFTAAAVIYPSLEKQRVFSETFFYSWRGWFDVLKKHQGAEAILFFGGKIVLLVLNLLALLGIIFWSFVFKKNRIIMFMLLFLIYYFILATGPAAYSRFRQPINPYIFILAALGVNWLLDYWFFKKHPKQSASSGAVSSIE